MTDLGAQDGRRRRAVENREKVARAMLDLIRETGEVPTAQVVAERAGLSRRSVFRLFEDLDDLHRAATEMMRAEVFARFPPPLEGATRAERVEALVAHRSALYEFIMPIRRVTETLKHRNALVRESQARSRALARGHLEGLFGPDLPAKGAERQRVLDGLYLASSWGAWAQLRDDLGYGVERSRAVMRRVVRSLLDSAGR